VFGDLTTLTDVRAWLQTGPQPYPSTDDALLARLITAASGFVTQWLNRPIVSADWQETRDGLGWWGGDDPTIVFAVQPVTAVLQVIIDQWTIPPIPAFTPAPAGQVATIQGFPYGPAGYLFTATALTIRGYPVPRRRGCISLTYTAGYSPVPYDIAQATIELVARKYRERTRIGERSKSLGGGETVAYETTSFSLKDMASDIQLLLAQYRQVAPVLGAWPMPAPTQTDPATVGAVLT
jgi:hypothetical protein